MSERPNLFPALDAATEAALRDSIQRFGVLVPVAKDHHGNLLDGFHRSRLADELGVKYRVDFISVADDEQGREVARTLNADRRHLTAKQRKEVVAALREQGHSLRAIAGVVGGDKKQVQRDLDKQVGTLSPPDKSLGRDGKRYPARRSTIVAAKDQREAERAQQALALTPTDELPAGRTIDVKRAERIAREREAERHRSEQAADVVVLPSGVDTRLGDLRTALEDLAGTVDAIITDPPYPAEFLDEFDALSETASRLLKPTGVLAAMVGQAHLPACIARLSQHLSYRWCAAYLTEGPATRIHARSVGTKWKPVLIYGGTRFLTQDVFTSGGDDKRHHHWGQSESGIADLVERLTEPGDLVVDPFLGGGTTAIVCRDLGRRFVGCDIDSDAIRTARERLAG